MKIHWLLKYYFIAFLTILSLVYIIENTEPYVNWTLYPKILKNDVQKVIAEKNCEKLTELFNSEYELNYEKNFFGFLIRKDGQSKRGLNFIKLLNYHLKKNNCIYVN